MSGGIGELITVAMIVFLVIPAPLFIVLYFITRWKQTRELSGGDEKMMEELWLLSEKLDGRLEALETILDNELPGWRKNR